MMIIFCSFARMLGIAQLIIQICTLLHRENTQSVSFPCLRGVKLFWPHGIHKLSRAGLDPQTGLAFWSCSSCHRPVPHCPRAATVGMCCSALEMHVAPPGLCCMQQLLHCCVGVTWGCSVYPKGCLWVIPRPTGSTEGWIMLCGQNPGRRPYLWHSWLKSVVNNLSGLDPHAWIGPRGPKAYPFPLLAPCSGIELWIPCYPHLASYARIWPIGWGSSTSDLHDSQWKIIFRRMKQNSRAADCLAVIPHCLTEQTSTLKDLRFSNI